VGHAVGRKILIKVAPPASRCRSGNASEEAETHQRARSCSRWPSAPQRSALALST
jgi:hypothetical protein